MSVLTLLLSLFKSFTREMTCLDQDLSSSGVERPPGVVSQEFKERLVSHLMGSHECTEVIGRDGLSLLSR